MAKRQRQVRVSFWVAFFSWAEVLLDRFGWPGFLLLFTLYFVEKNGSIEQKRAIIDAYFLGQGLSVQYPLLILGGLSLLAFLSQWRYFSRKIRLLKEELKRLGKWKTDHQEKLIGGPLHHSGEQEG